MLPARGGCREIGRKIYVAPLRAAFFIIPVVVDGQDALFQVDHQGTKYSMDVATAVVHRVEHGLVWTMVLSNIARATA